MSKQLYAFQNNIKVIQHRLKATFVKKKNNQQNQRYEIAQLLKENRINHAKIKTEYIIRDDYLIEAMEIIELYLELLLVRSQLILKQDFDENCLEAIAGLLYSSPRIVDLQELNKLQKLLVPLCKSQFSIKSTKCIETPELIAAIQPKLKRLVDMSRAPPELVVRYCQEIADAYQIKVIITNSDLLENTKEIEELLQQIPDDDVDSDTAVEGVTATDIQLLQNRLDSLKK